MRSNRSVVISEVIHVALFSASPVNYHIVQLFIFPIRGSEGVLFFGCFYECCIERHTVLNHQPLLHPDPTFVGFSRCMRSNVVIFRVHTKSKLSVEIARDDRSMS